MLVFPQLNSGAIFQTRFHRVRATHTPVNLLSDGSKVEGNLPSTACLVWEAPLTALSDEEAGRIEQLFEAVDGRASTFLFLDPADNLLQWSEDPARGCWQAGAMLQITTGIADPLGGTSAVRLTNAGQSAQELVQVLDVPANLQYCFSVYARAAAPCVVDLMISAAGGRRVATHSVGQAWTRPTVGGTPAAGDQTSFGVEIPAGASVDLFGFQADAQPGPSAYRKTLARNGVYRAARFDSDSLSITTESAGSHAAVIRIVAQVGV